MDDTSPRPMAPELDMSDIAPEDNALQEDKAVADALHHPAWDKVEEYFNQEIAANSDISRINPDLKADEYKIEALASAKYAVMLKTTLDWIKNAAAAIESGGK